MLNEELATAMNKITVNGIFGRILLCIAVFFTFHSSFLISQAGAQGLPLIRNYTAAEYGGHNHCDDIEIDEDGTVFVANFEGLLYYDHSRWRIIRTPELNRVTVVYRDSQNTIWVGCYNYFARLQKRANGELYMQQVGKDDQFRGEVMEIFEEDSVLQFITSDNNLYEVHGNTVSLKKRTNTDFNTSLTSDIISLDALKAGRKNVILNDTTQVEKLDGGLQVIVKKNNGLIIADGEGNSIYTLTEKDGLCSDQVSYVAYDGHGTLWGATAHGIFAIELPSVYSYILAKDGLSGEVHTITAFNGKIYVGSTNGLFSIASQQCEKIAEVNNICWTLCQSRDGLLAATSSGIYRISADGRVSKQTPNTTYGMLVDDDKVYAGESDGVWLYQSGQRKKINDFPLVTEIRQITHQSTDSAIHQGTDLWFRNVYGETIGKDPGKEYKPLDELPAYLTMPVSGIEVKAQYRQDDKIWIGGDEVLAIIDLGKKELTSLTDCPIIRIRSIVMGSDSVLWGGYGDMPKQLPTLDSDEGNLHFFYALSYAPLSGKTLYRYKLNNNKWSAWSDRQDVDFLNLPYGSFTLSVQAQLANGELSEVKTVEFSIAYPLLMRWYMVVLYFILFAYIVFQLFRYRLKRLQKDKIKLEQIVEERTADLRNAQSELIRQEKMASVGKLTEGLIDRILNPMNYIINFSKMSNDLLKDLKENINNNKDSMNEDDYEDTLDVLDMLTENLQNVDQYGQNTTRTLKAMEEMLKDRTGGYVDMDLLPVLQQNEKMVNNYFAKEKEQYHIQTIFNLPGDAMPLHGNPDMLSKTIMSLLGNAVYAVVKKYQRAPYTPEVSLTATIADSQYILKIHDNGTGIGESTIGKIFDPFFTTKTTAEAAGVGLYLSREIIQNHGGDISVTSVKDQYTEFTITLPVGKRTSE